DVLVLPTVATPSARYTSPLKLFEYMASGRPIVASDLEPIREVLTDGQNARLVPPGEPAALATAVRELLADPAQAEQLARTAFEQASSYSWSRRADRIEQLLNDVVRAS
ncbi:MAG: glycosyltransferase, partial [Vicinamibacterales bacterium]|nr:glycosyltransferase [Vicinamibacterales bacterium]